jgi:hypothetical protein
MLPTLFVTKVPLEVPHDCGTALLITGMCFEAPFFKKRRSPLDPESSRTLLVFLTISSLLTLLLCLTVQFWHDLAIFCLDFDPVLVKITYFIAVFVFNLLFLRFRLETVITATTAVTLPVFLRVTVFSLSLDTHVLWRVKLVTLIGRAVVDKKFEPKGLSILRRLSLLDPVSQDQIS